MGLMLSLSPMHGSFVAVCTYGSLYGIAGAALLDNGLSLFPFVGWEGGAVQYGVA